MAVDSAIEIVPPTEEELMQAAEIELAMGDGPLPPEGVEFLEDMDGGMIVDFDPETGMMPPGDLPHNANLAEFLDDELLDPLAAELIDLFEEDKESRADWLQSFSEGLTLLGTENEERTEPFEGATGVHHPLLAEAATQFQAQAYKELLPANGPVNVKVVGQDSAVPADPKAAEQPMGKRLADQAARVKEFMNYQIMHVMEEYDPELDQMLFYLPLSGSAFKKVYYDETYERAVSKFITAEDLVVNYAATDLRTAARITHVIQVSENDLRRQQVYGFYKDVDLTGPAAEPDESILDQKINELQGTTPSRVGNEMYTLLEMHVDLDIPGFEDIHPETGEPSGVALPYIVTIVEDTQQILAVRRNWNENDPRKVKKDYFVQYKFLPGLGFYGFGLIHMIGGLSKSATSILRQLVDAGTLSNLPAGFKARGLRVSNEEEPIAPGEWRDVDAPGGSLRDSLMPLPYKEPSAVLFQLLGMLVESGRRFAAIADMAVSETGSQQNPVGTTLALLERGTKVMSAIHKRLHYAQKKEFQLLARVFGDTVPEYPYQVGGGDVTVIRADFDDRVDVLPVSDPNIFSMSQRVMMAQQQLQMAQAAPEIHDLREAYRRMYEALEVKNIEGLLKPKKIPEPRTPAQQIQDILQNNKVEAFPGQDHMAHITALIGFVMHPMIQGMPEFYMNGINGVMSHLNLMAQEQVEMEMQQMMQQMGGQVPPQAQQQLMQQMQVRMAQVESQMLMQVVQQITPPPQPDPMLQMHDKEMQIKMQTEAQKSQDNNARVMADLEKARMQAMQKQREMDLDVVMNEQRIAQNREQAFLNAETARQKTYADLQKEVARSRNMSNG
jgi:hypothetical protein